jgi:CRISPR-associated exonuclease Cas4
LRDLPSPGARLGDECDLVTVSEIEHMAYCARQWALISVDGTWSDNASTAFGNVVHERVDLPAIRTERGGTVLRGLTIWSEQHGLIGRADVVEFDRDGTPFPVEYKSGRRAMAAAEIQVVAQAMCLSEMFSLDVTRGAVWLHGRRRRHEVAVTETAKAIVLAHAVAIREARLRSTLPAAVHDARCRDCSLINECVPGLVSERRRVRAIHAALFVTPDLDTTSRSDA